MLGRLPPHAAFTASRHHSRHLVCEQMQQHCMVFVCVCVGKWLCTPHCVGRGVQWMWPVTAGAVFVCSSCWRQWGHAQPWQSPGVLVLLMLLLQLEKRQ